MSGYTLKKFTHISTAAFVLDLGSQTLGQYLHVEYCTPSASNTARLSLCMYYVRRDLRNPLHWSDFVQRTISNA